MYERSITRAAEYSRQPLNSPIEAAFDALGERDALRLLERLAYRFSYSRGHDAIYAGVREIAVDAAESEGYCGDDLAARYLDDDV